LLAIEPGHQRGQKHLKRNHSSTLRHGQPTQFSDTTGFTCLGG
jgi:hypothetical protein